MPLIDARRTGIRAAKRPDCGICLKRDARWRILLVLVWGDIMRNGDSQVISSALLGKAAYDRTLGKKPSVPMQRRPSDGAPAADPRRAELATREIKASVLRSLHARSNAGMVAIKDVSVALDRLMKKT